MLIGRSHFAHQALADIIPLRNAFAALFFISLGMLTSPEFIGENWSDVILVTLTIVLSKFFICSFIAWLFGYSLKTILFVGAGLIQVGEFSFILASAGLENGVISERLYSLVLSSAIFTILLTPFMLSLAGASYGWLSRFKIMVTLVHPGRDKALAESKESLSDHVVICGYGRVGSNLASSLEDYNFPYLVIELNPQIVAEMRAQGTPCIYGDAGNHHILAMAGLETAKVLALTCPDPLALTAAVSYARGVNPNLNILARATDPLVDERLEKLGVSELVEPEFETSLEFVRHTLQIYSVDTDEVEKLVCTDLRAIAIAERKRKHLD
jgi:CPA2 family monovalent cation:H+ antiporter-2